MSKRTRKTQRQPNLPPMTAAETRKPEGGFVAGSGREFSPDYSHVRKDLRRIAILAGGLVALLIALSFFIR